MPRGQNLKCFFFLGSGGLCLGLGAQMFELILTKCLSPNFYGMGLGKKGIEGGLITLLISFVSLKVN